VCNKIITGLLQDQYGFVTGNTSSLRGRYGIKQGSAAGLCRKALPQGSAARLCRRALPQGSAARLCRKALPQGSAAGLCRKRLCRRALPQGSAAELCRKALPQGSAAGLCRRTLPQGSAARLCRKALPQGSAAGLCRRALPQGSAAGLCRKALPQGSAAGLCRRALPQGSAAGLCRRALPQGPAARLCRRALPQGSAAGLCRRALPQGSAAGLCRRLCRRALPQGSAARLCRRALPQGSAAGLCRRALPHGSAAVLCRRLCRRAVVRTLSLEAFLDLDIEQADRMLAAHGHYCFTVQHSRLQFMETINAVVDLRRAWRRCLPQSWDVAWVWRGLVESHSHIPMPDFVFLAFCSLSLLWNWPDIVALLIGGFLGLLRPGELHHLQGQDIIFPSHFSRFNHMFLAIRSPKNRCICARREHVRIDDLEVLPLFRSIKNVLQPSDQIFAGTQREFRNCFEQLCMYFDIRCNDTNGLAPASLRAGGATFLYQQCDQPEVVRFRGRWSNNRMLEIYIQEVTANTFADTLRHDQGARLFRFAEAAPGLLAVAAMRLFGSMCAGFGG
jgi:hypothetical protein